MEESQEILLSSLAKSGVAIPADVSTIGDLTPSLLISICFNALRLVDPAQSVTSLPTSLSEDLIISDRFKLCSDLAAAFKTLGFIGEISFHNFLYPSEEDLYKLVRFLVENLPGPGEAQKDAERQINEDGDKISCLRNEKSVRSETEAASDGVDASSSSGGASCSKVLANLGDDQDSIKKMEDLKLCDTREERISYKVNRKIGKLRYKEELLIAELNRRSSELQRLHDDHELLKSVAKMELNDKHPLDFYIKQLDDRMGDKKKNLVEVESRWGATKASLEEKRSSLQEAVAAKLPEAFEKFEQLNRIELETEAVLAETKNREEELSKLSADLENQPQLAPRKSYIERIKEITKNSRKQDTDVERILKETRELQLESNSIRERLHRTYMVVDETVFREAKKDPVVQQAYRLLTSIHGSFEQIAEKILATDRTRREVADYEAKLATVTSRSLNLDKLKADLDAIRKENDLLEQRLHSS